MINNGSTKLAKHLAVVVCHEDKTFQILGTQRVFILSFKKIDVVNRERGTHEHRTGEKTSIKRVSIVNAELICKPE
jgi:hypothetical protein